MGRNGGGSARATRLVVAGVALAGALAARGADLSARADLGAGADEDATSARQFVRQTYQLRYGRQISPPLSYRLTLLYQDDRSRLELEDGAVRERATELSPSAYLSWRLDDLSVVFSGSLNDGAAWDSERARTISRTIQRYNASARVSLMDGADVTAFASRLAFSGTALDTTRDGAGVGLEWALGAFQLSNVNRVERFEDGEGDLTRTSLGPRVSLQYTNNRSKRWSTWARYDLDYLRTEQVALTTGAIAVPSDVQPIAGLFGIDDLPDQTGPLAAEPRLVDGALETSAGVALGPGGESFQNLGVDLGRSVALDELRVHVRTGTGQPVPFGGPVTFTAWWSQDGSNWTPLAGTTDTFSTGMSAYVLTFARTSARFFKVVTFGTNTVDTFVTELQTFVRETFVEGETRVAHTVRQGLSVNAGARLHDQVAVAYVGQVNASSTRTFSGDTQAASDTLNTATLELGPFDALRFDVVGSQLFATSAAGAGQSKTTGAVAATYKPIERFRATAQGHTSAERYARIRTRTYGALLGSSATIYDTLLASATAGFNRQYVVGGGRTDYLLASVNVVAHLRRDLEGRLDVALQRSISEAGDPASVLTAAPGLRALTFQRFAADLRYRPSPQLDLLGRVGYATTSTGSGMLRKARANWEPFPGGALRLSLDYDVEVDPLTGRSYTQLSAQPQWLINRHATLSLRYNDVRASGSVATRQQSVSLNLSVAL